MPVGRKKNIKLMGLPCWWRFRSLVVLDIRWHPLWDATEKKLLYYVPAIIEKDAPYLLDPLN